MGPKRIADGDGCFFEGGIWFKLNSSSSESQRDEVEVFYNPSQVLNRNLSVEVLRAFHQIMNEEMKIKFDRKVSLVEKSREPTEDLVFSPKDLAILEPLGATGIRSCRYVKELQGLVSFSICNDLDRKATQASISNRDLNDISPETMVCTCADANDLMSGGDSHLLEQLKKQPDSFIQSHIKKIATEYLNPPPEGANVDQMKLENGLLGQKINVIDLDPYGSCVPFLANALKRIEDGGLICLTSTDMQVLGGKYPETSYSRYGGAQTSSAHQNWIHESSLRLLLHRLGSIGADRGLAIVPLLSLSIDFYVRCFVQVRKKPSSVKNLASLTCMRVECSRCQSFSNMPLGSWRSTKKDDTDVSSSTSFPDSLNDDEDQLGYPKLQYGDRKYRLSSFKASNCFKCACVADEATVTVTGPFYCGSLWNPRFVKLLRANMENLPSDAVNNKIKATLGVMTTELRDIPLYYHPRRICSHTKIPIIPIMMMRRALNNGGYRFSVHHRDPEAVKTDAPTSFIHAVIARWAQKKGVSFSKDSFLSAALELHQDRVDFKGNGGEVQKRVLRFPANPEENWGPMNKPRKAEKGNCRAVE